jgi:hypothetical protein
MLSALDYSDLVLEQKQAHFLLQESLSLLNSDLKTWILPRQNHTEWETDT